MGNEHTYNETPDVLALLDQELASCVMPSIPDPAKATSEDLIRDLHRVLAGNGGPTRGLIYKTASTNVSMKLVRNDAAIQTRKQDELAAMLAAQKARCDEVQAVKAATLEAETHAKEVAAAVAEAEHTTVKRIGMAIKDNKSVIIVIIVSALLILNSYRGSAGARTDPKVIEQALRTILDSELKQLQPESAGSKSVEHRSRGTNRVVAIENL